MVPSKDLRVCIDQVQDESNADESGAEPSEDPTDPIVSIYPEPDDSQVIDLNSISGQISISNGLVSKVESR